MHGVARLMKALAMRSNVAVVCTTHTVGGAQVPPYLRLLSIGMLCTHCVPCFEGTRLQPVQSESGCCQ